MLLFIDVLEMSWETDPVFQYFIHNLILFQEQNKGIVIPPLIYRNSPDRGDLPIPPPNTREFNNNNDAMRGPLWIWSPPLKFHRANCPKTEIRFILTNHWLTEWLLLFSVVSQAASQRRIPKGCKTINSDGSQWVTDNGTLNWVDFPSMKWESHHFCLALKTCY